MNRTIVTFDFVWTALGARHSSMEDLEGAKRPHMADQHHDPGMGTPDPLKDDKKKDRVRLSSQTTFTAFQIRFYYCSI